MTARTPTLQPSRDPAATTADLDYALDLAREGSEVPLVGGPIGLMWGVLLTVTLGLHYLVVSGTLGVSPEWLGALWLAFAVLGGLGVAVLGRRVGARPGALSVNNRMETNLWIMFSAVAATLVTGVMARLILVDTDPAIWDFVAIFGFAGQTLIYGAIARQMRIGWAAFAGLAAAVATAATLATYGLDALYLVAAIATVFTVVIPSLLSMKHAR